MCACGSSVYLGCVLGAVRVAELCRLTDYSGALLQAEDRAHRYGTQAESVNIYYIIGKKTIDESIWSMIRFARTTHTHINKHTYTRCQTTLVSPRTAHSRLQQEAVGGGLNAERDGAEDEHRKDREEGHQSGTDPLIFLRCLDTAVLCP